VTELLIGLVAGALLAGGAAALVHRKRVATLAGLVAEATARGDAEAVAHHRLAQGLDAIPEGVAICDGDGRIVFHNATGMNYSEARHGDALVEAAIDELLAGAVQGRRDTRSLELYGPPRRALDLSAVPIEGGRSGALIVVQDVSERRRLDAVRATSWPTSATS